jgi:2,5-diamino-6-(ribosylamino)-4(3H)-pyrimidinone 5'-phosphate reductase
MAPFRPRVLVNFATSIDGKITLASGLRKGAFTMSRHHEDHRRMRKIRSSADAILIGAGNLRADNPKLALSQDERIRRRAGGEREPYRIVVTRRGEGLFADRKVFDPKLGGDTIVMHADTMPAATREKLSEVATLVALGEQSVDIGRMLDWIGDELGVRTLLCEGGGVLVGALFAARAVDELYITLVPRILGGADTPTLSEGRGFLPDEIPDARLAMVERVGDELFLRYDFRWDV